MRKPKPCECGNEMPMRSKQCQRCRDLDGHTVGEFRVITALRESGTRCDVYEIAQLASVTTRSVLRQLGKLAARDRVTVLRQSSPSEGRTLYGLREARP